MSRNPYGAKGVDRDSYIKKFRGHSSPDRDRGKRSSKDEDRSHRHASPRRHHDHSRSDASRPPASDRHSRSPSRSRKTDRHHHSHKSSHSDRRRRDKTPQSSPPPTSSGRNSAAKEPTQAPDDENHSHDTSGGSVEQHESDDSELDERQHTPPHSKRRRTNDHGDSVPPTPNLHMSDTDEQADESVRDIPVPPATLVGVMAPPPPPPQLPRPPGSPAPASEIQIHPQVGDVLGEDESVVPEDSASQVQQASPAKSVLKVPAAPVKRKRRTLHSSSDEESDDQIPEDFASLADSLLNSAQKAQSLADKPVGTLNVSKTVAQFIDTSYRTPLPIGQLNTIIRQYPIPNVDALKTPSINTNLLDFGEFASALKGSKFPLEQNLKLSYGNFLPVVGPLAQIVDITDAITKYVNFSFRRNFHVLCSCFLFL
jgi:hypothetical protein